MAQPKWSSHWYEVCSFGKVCLQCHHPVSDSHEFCSQACSMQYWREFRTSGKKMCGLPGCSKPCYVEHGRIHDYCGRTHATEHAAMMDAVVASKKSKGKGSGSKTKGLQPQSHFQFTSQTPHGGYFAASASQYTDEGPDGYESDTTSEVSGDSNDEGSDDYSDEEPSPVPLRQQPRPQMVYGAPGMQQSPPASTYLQDCTATQCMLPGCSRPVYVDPANGRVHSFCCRAHAYKAPRKDLQDCTATQCMLPGCSRPVYVDPANGRVHSFCCRAHASEAHRKDLQDCTATQCMLPGCSRPVYVDPANGRVHSFCCRAHAYEAPQKGLHLDTVGIRRAKSKEFQEVSLKFRQAWVKGQCPKVGLVFVITNTRLKKRYDAYRRTLSKQSREEHYHGTKLKCNIKRDQHTCSDSDCGICGISSMGLDRRCIQKNISYQRFGHGFYLAPNSSKCHDYTQGAHNYRAMLLCEVAPGNKYLLQKNGPDLKAPPQGFDSVYGKSAAGSASVLNYDEIVIYNPDSVLPRYIIMYQKDGTHKIAH